MVMVLVLLLKSLNRICKSVLMLHCGKNILAIKAIPGGSYDNSICVVLTEKAYTLGNFLIARSLGVREHDRRSVLYLIVIELAKVLHIHLTLTNVCNRGKAIENCAVLLRCLCGTDNVRKLTNARGLYNNSVRIILLKHLYKRLGKISYKRTADTSRVHLGNLDTCISEKSTVNTYFTKLILNKHNLFACVCLFNKLLYQRGLACAKEAGKNIYFCHFESPSINTFTNNIVLQIYKKVKITFLKKSIDIYIYMW